MTNLRCLDNLGGLLEKSLLVFHLESRVHPNLSHFLSEVCFSARRTARVYVKCMPNAKPPLIHTWLGLECTLSHPTSTSRNVITLSREYGIHVAAYIVHHVDGYVHSDHLLGNLSRIVGVLGVKIVSRLRQINILS